MLAALPTLASAEDGEYCVIPKLVLGVPTTVEVPYIDKPFCGMALIDSHYVRLSEISKATEEGLVSCASDASCIKTLRYYRDEAKSTEPYIIIFQGPRHRKSA
jgi:hypothetical protein